MRLLLTLLITSSMFGQAMPDPKITPGKTRQVTVKELCTTSTRAVRHTTESMKRQVFAEYHLCNGGRDMKCRKGYEVDHLLSLEISGADDVLNLWPEPYLPIPGAHQKDVLENFLHRQVCKGNMSLPDAQDCIKKNWYECYKKYGFAGKSKR